MAFAGSFEHLVALGGIHGLAKAFAQPASDTLPPRLVDDKDLLAANAILGAGSESAIVFGPLVAALAIAAWGLKGAFFVDAATYAFGIAVVLPLRLRTLHERPAERTRLRTEIAEGLRIVREQEVLKFTLVLSTMVFLTWGAYVVVEPIYVRDVLGKPASFFAALQTAFGVGLVATGLLMPKLGDRVAGPRALSMSVVLSGLTAALYVGTRIPAVAMVGVFLWGVDVAFFSAPSRTLLQRNAPPEAHGRVLALYRTTHSVSDVAALPLAGLAAGLVGVQATALTMASFAFVAGLVGYRVAGHVVSRASGDVEMAPVAVAPLG
jgi:predicted MFS family arabinose efflux permease